MRARVAAAFEQSEAEDMDTLTLFDGLAEAIEDFLHSVNLSVHDVEDVVQDTFLIVIELGGYHKGLKSPKNWVFRIARLQTLKHFRQERSDRKVLVPSDDEVDTADVATSPSHLLMRTQIFQETVNDLPSDQRVCFVLHEAGRFTHEEIAEIEEIPIGTVHSRVRLAREFLAKRMALLTARDRSAKVLRQKSKNAQAS